MIVALSPYAQNYVHTARQFELQEKKKNVNNRMNRNQFPINNRYTMIRLQFVNSYFSSHYAQQRKFPIVQIERNFIFIF